jgi:phosphopantetheinyl transferase
MDEVSVFWRPLAHIVAHHSSDWRHAAGRAQLEYAGRMVTGHRLTISYGCRVCGSDTHGAPYYSQGWSAFVGCSLTYVRGFALAVVSLRRRAEDGGLLPGPLPVGIDGEPVAQGSDPSEGAFAHRILTRHEAAYVGRLTDRHAHDALLRTWTEKEAVLKAGGWGLSLDPRMVSTSLGSSRVRLDVDGRTRSFHVWHLAADHFPEPWVVCVATAASVRAQSAAIRLLAPTG